MADNELAPIVIFGFNRVEAIKTLFESLSLNPEFGDSKVYVFIDGPRNEAEKIKTEAVAKLARAYTSDVIISDYNKGLGASIIVGVTEIISHHGSAIVIEDDLVLAPNFLAFMNEGLKRYKEDRRIISVCGYGLRVNRPKGYEGDVYLSDRSSSWGWATWSDRWNNIDWKVKDWKEFSADREAQRRFNRGGSDMTSMLRGYMDGKNRSWAIRFCYSQFKQGLYSVHPFLSKVENEGFGANATNCKQKYSRFRTDFDLSGNREFKWPVNVRTNENILKQLHGYHSIPRRIYSLARRILNI